ncbi:MAG: hypothetical protein ACP5O7_06280 [Phycisphaerae bacterium]
MAALQLRRTIALGSRLGATLVASMMLLALVSLAGCQSMNNSAAWKCTVKRDLPLYGDRNWIAIVDSAYPDQSKAGVTTIVANGGMFSTLKYVLAKIAKAPNIRPVAYTDRELNDVTDQQTPGISAYRQKLDAMLAAAGVPHKQRMHIKSIDRLNSDGKLFKILIIKTNLTMPYTSVFIHLKCGYWTDADENALRAAMQKK